MGAILLSPLYILLNIYLILRMLRWFSTLHSFLGNVWFVIPFLTCYVVLALTPLSAAFIRGRLAVPVKRISNYWLGTLMYLLLYLLLADLGRILLRIFQGRSLFSQLGTDNYRILGGIVFIATLLTSFYGIFHAAHVKKTCYQVTVPKNCPLSSLKIALAADLHLGSGVGLTHMKKITKIIRDMQPDLILFAGDIFDNDFDAIDDPQSLSALLADLKSTYGSYSCWGNHDISERILAGFTFSSGGSPVSNDPRMKQFMKNSRIRVLEDETLLIDSAFYLTGRLDASCKEKSGTIRLAPLKLTSGLDLSRPVLVLDHQPSQLKELAQAGVDLTLSGHTHDGQLFPGNLTTRIGWMNSCGKLMVDSMISIVTSGAGIWGPAMRIGTDNEVVEITVNFTQ